VFKLAIGQLTLKFEGVANTSIGKFLRFSMATRLEEVSKTVKSRRQRLWYQRLDLL
jgi:hypothetical protein